MRSLISMRLLGINIKAYIGLCTVMATPMYRPYVLMALYSYGPMYLWPCIVMAYIVMAYIVMAYLVMAYLVMACIVMAHARCVYRQ